MRSSWPQHNGNNLCLYKALSTLDNPLCTALDNLTLQTQRIIYMFSYGSKYIGQSRVRCSTEKILFWFCRGNQECKFFDSLCLTSTVLLSMYKVEKRRRYRTCSSVLSEPFICSRLDSSHTTCSVRGCFSLFGLLDCASQRTLINFVKIDKSRYFVGINIENVSSSGID